MGKELSVTVTIKENDELQIKSVLNETGILILLSQAITSIAMGSESDVKEVTSNELQ